ncbi:unnamed protein product [Symbiodinium natans]|uniref:Uncharacterized protein n=1 Tax=Symbiodinium natans TaxID=878477 RepID=A0A812PQU2_9DINO|nr:unnamed protein product [Symbiodinium natans]
MRWILVPHLLCFHVVMATEMSGECAETQSESDASVALQRLGSNGTVRKATRDKSAYARLMGNMQHVVAQIRRAKEAGRSIDVTRDLDDLADDFLETSEPGDQQEQADLDDLEDGFLETSESANSLVQEEASRRRRRSRRRAIDFTASAACTYFIFSDVEFRA